MDKGWMHLNNRASNEYINGARRFIDWAKGNARSRDAILCPCKHCLNAQYQSFDMVYEHIVINGMDSKYTVWVFHGERRSAQLENEGDEDRVEMPETYEIFRDAYFDGEDNAAIEPNDVSREEKFRKSLEYAETPLYPHCTKYTIMSATVALYKHKAAHNLSDTGFNELLNILRDMLPPDNKLPEGMSTTKKLLKIFDLGYEKIHACAYDCCLFRKENKDLNTCPKCGTSRWKMNKQSKKVREGVPAKVIWYFPIVPRFRRLFRSIEKAEQVLWHSTNKSQDRKMRHPVDSLAWDVINKKWPCFASDPRNLRLGLAADGVNPFGDLSTKHSCWPVILVVYNFDPLLCMSKDNMMLTLLISGPKQPRNDIDVFLEPLVEDLKELWENGVELYDSFTKSMFNLKVVLMWTINDLPAYSNLSRQATKGECGCPVCAKETCSEWLPCSKKTVFRGSRRFLPINHPYRKKKTWFDGKEELRRPPRLLSGSEIFCLVENLENKWGKPPKECNNSQAKTTKKRNRSKGKPPQKRNNSKEKPKTWPWKKKSIFFELPYWEALLLRHNLDVMHIEKNVCESIIGTLLNMKEKSKDGLKSRQDLKQMGIRGDLHPKELGKKHYLPPAPHTLSKEEKGRFCRRLQQLKLPDGYSSNIGQRVSLDECKISGLKSHDCHVLIQQLLPVALRGLLPKGPRNAIFRLCSYFHEICQRVIDRKQLEKLESEIVETLCMFERFFPPSFFDIMVHVTIHLAREALFCGPVQFRWMYPFERIMKVYKGFVRNRGRPEGCIAECYLVDECVQFCSEHMKKAAEIGFRQSRNEDIECESIEGGHKISKGIFKTMPSDMLAIAHHYVLFNNDEVQPYIKKHREELKLEDSRLARNENALEKKHMDTFSSWLRIVIHGDHNVSSTLKWLARGPRTEVTSYSGYIVNGQRFHTKDVERSTQNSGVSIEAETICRSSDRDTNQVVEKISYYGVLKDIILLNYYTFNVPLFPCDWANIRNGIKVEDGFTLVNLHEGQSQFARDPFILVSQASQVFYSKENETSSWYVVLKAPPRGSDDVDNFEENPYVPYAPLDISRLDSNVDDDDHPYVRDDCEGRIV